MKYYLAYGSNLNKYQMNFRCPDAVPAGSCVLNNWELVFRRGVLTIEPCPGGIVPLGIWKISENDEKSLDRYEGFPSFYYKKTLRLPVLSPRPHGRGGFKVCVVSGILLHLRPRPHGRGGFKVGVALVEEAAQLSPPTRAGWI